nr:hypothetical protein [Tanacetum cinerariifolium]
SALEVSTYSDDEDAVGVEADINNLESSIQVSPIPTTRIHKDHPISQIIDDLSSTTQTRRYKYLNAEFEECFNNSSNGVNAASSSVFTAGYNIVNSTNNFSAAGPSNTTVSLISEPSSFQDASTSSHDPYMSALEAEAVNTACYVQNRVLVTKPHNKTTYELLH